MNRTDEDIEKLKLKLFMMEEYFGLSPAQCQNCRRQIYAPAWAKSLCVQCQELKERGPRFTRGPENGHELGRMTDRDFYEHLKAILNNTIDEIGKRHPHPDHYFECYTVTKKMRDYIESVLATMRRGNFWSEDRRKSLDTMADWQIKIAEILNRENDRKRECT